MPRIRESVGHKTNLLRQRDNGAYCFNFSLHRPAIRLKIEKIRVCSPTRLATIAYVRQTFSRQVIMDMPTHTINRGARISSLQPMDYYTIAGD